MKYFLVSWLVSSSINEGNWVKNIVSADNADEALLKNLIDYGCVPAKTTMKDISEDKETLTNGISNTLKYTPDMLEGCRNSEELMIATTDCGAKVFLPADIMSWHESNENMHGKENDQPYAINVLWNTCGVEHIIEDTVWEHDINRAILESLVGCLPVGARKVADFTQSAFGFNNNYRIELKNEVYSLAKVELLQYATVTIDNHKIDVLVPRGHLASNSPVLAKVLQ